MGHSAYSLTSSLDERTPVTRRAVVVAVIVVAAVVVAAGVFVLVRKSSEDGPVLLPAGSTWRYNDSGKDLGVAWRQSDYDDSAWPQGVAPFGYGQVVATPVTYGPDEGHKQLTTYFRSTFEVPSDVPGVEVRIRRDDGAVVYLNGSEVLRTGMRDGEVTSTTPARYTQEDGSVWISAELPSSVVAPGPNVVAVEVHQSAPDSSDMYFDMQILGMTTPPVHDTPVPPGATRVLAAGDIGECGGAAPETAELLEQIQGPFLALGDIAYPKGAVEDYQNCYDPSYGPFKDRTEPVPGNHDYMTDGAKPYFDYFGSRVGTQAAPWYSRDIGDWHIVFLNSNCEDVGGCDESSPQYRWLAKDLAAAPRTCLAAVWHHPRYSSSEYGDNTDVSPMFRALVQAGGDLVLNGHAHFYERYPRMDDNSQPSPKGMREFIAGTGGANLYEFAAINPASEVRWNQGHGVLQLDLRPDGYDWRFLPTDAGVVVDSGSDTC